MNWKDTFKKWFKDFDVKLEVFLNRVLDLSWKKVILGAIITLLGAGALFILGILLYWTLPPVISFIWSGIAKIGWGIWIGLRFIFWDLWIWLLNFFTHDLWVGLWKLYWNARFWSYLNPPGDELGYFVVFVKVLGLALIAALIFLWALPTWLERRKEKKTTSASAQATVVKLAFHERQRAKKWKFMPYYIVKVFHGGAVERFGRYVRVRKPGEIGEIDERGTILRYRKRRFKFLGGIYLKLPGLEIFEDIYLGTQKSTFRSIKINTAGVKEPPVKPIFEALEQSVELTAGKEIASANGPQVDAEFFFLWEVHQIIWWLRLDDDIRRDVTREIGGETIEVASTDEDGKKIVTKQTTPKKPETVSGFQANIMEPTINNFLQDTLPDMLMGDIQRAPSSLFLIGTRDELRGRPNADRKILREEELIEYWSKLLNDPMKPFYKIDDENLDSSDSREVIEEITTKSTPYGDRNRRNCVLASLMQSGGIRIRQFRKSEIEPEAALRAAITRKGVAQVDFETGVIGARKNYAIELVKQGERIASAKTDAEKANIVVKDCGLPPEIKPFLITFFQQQRTREVMSQGAGSTFVVGEEILSNLGGLIDRFMSQFNSGKKA